MTSQYSLLPSYQMHQALLAKSVSIPMEMSDYDSDDSLPSYDMDSESCSLRYPSSISTYASNNESTVISSNDVVGDTILDVHHQLKVLKCNLQIKMEIHLTESPGIPGVEPTYIENHEYNQGDLVCGYVVIESNSNIPIAFTMIYILLEGNIVRGEIFDSSKKRTSNFLQVVDLVASSHKVNIDKLPEIDRVDNTHLQFGLNDFLYPGIKYKRFFSFRIPHNLLESNCKNPNLSQHLRLPPSFDSLAFLNTSIKYSVHARCIAPDTNTREYYSLQDSEREVRIVPTKVKMSSIEDLFLKAQVKYSFDNLFNKIRRDIQIMKEIRGMVPAAKIYKYRKNETAQPQFTFSPDVYNVTSQLMKRSISGSKNYGNIRLSVPAVEKVIPYIPQREYRSNDSVPPHILNSWKISFPVELILTTSSKVKPPKIKLICSSLVIVSFATSSEDSIPLEFDSDMIFNNSTGENFSSIVQRPISDLSTQLMEQIKETEGVHCDKYLLDELRSIGNVRQKTVSLQLDDVKVSPNAGRWSMKNGQPVANFMVYLDLASACLNNARTDKGKRLFDLYSLVPEFQHCKIAQMYYIETNFILNNGTSMSIKLPLSIQKH